MKKVSIVIPVYNTEKYIEKCVNSVLAQSYQEIEIILVDDGSTDTSPKICDRLANNNEVIKVIHTNNQGVACARNVGIESSSGEYTQFVDSDDYIDSDMTEYLVKNFEKEDVDIVLCGYKREYQEKSERVTPEKYVGTVLGLDEMLGYWLLDPIVGSPCNKLFLKEIIDSKNIRFHEGMNYAEDYCFCMDYMRYVNRISILSDAKYHYRDTPHSLTKGNTVDAERLWHDQMQAFLSLVKIIDGVEMKREGSTALKQLYSYICTLNLYKRIRCDGIIASYKWIKNNISKGEFSEFIKSTNQIYRVGKLNYLLKILKRFL